MFSNCGSVSDLALGLLLSSAGGDDDMSISSGFGVFDVISEGFQSVDGWHNGVGNGTFRSGHFVDGVALFSTSGGSHVNVGNGLSVND